MSSLFPQAQRLKGDEGSDVWGLINAAAASSPIQPVSHMGQGFFGYNPPQFVLDAAQQSVVREDCNQYAPTKGRLRLRQILADIYSPLLDHTIDPATDIMVSTGANEGIFCAMMAFVEPGDEVIIIEPLFSYYDRAVLLAGGLPRYVALKTPPEGPAHSSEWTLDIRDVANAISSKTKALIVNSPHNPLGKVFTSQELREIAAICLKHSIMIISDEVYEHLSYTPFTRTAALSPEIFNITLTIGSAGKTFYATGWRVGYLIGPEHLIEPVTTAHRGIAFASPSASQEAVAIAYEQAEINNFWNESREEMKAKMTRFNEIWDELGLSYTAPEGGYYVVVDIRQVKIPETFVFPADIANREADYKVSWFLIQELGVAALPLSDFYSAANKHQAKNYLRFAVCKPDAALDLAKERLRGLKKFLP